MGCHELLWYGEPRPQLKLELVSLSTVQKEGWGRSRLGDGHTMGLESPVLGARNAQAHCVVSDVLCLVLQQG